MNIHRRSLTTALLALVMGLGAPAAWADQTPDGLVQSLSTQMMDIVRNDKAIQAGDIKRISAVVDEQVMPHVNFQRMTASAVGRYWRQATPEQRQRLQEEFKQLIIRTYAGAVSQVNDQRVVVRPMRSRPEDTEVIVRTEIRGKGEPVQVDYRLEKAGNTWRIYDVNVLGIWMVENYRNSFAQEISQGGIDGLINKLAERNRAPVSARS